MSNPIPPKTPSSLNRLIAAKAIRGFGDGFVSLLLPVYLLNLGLTAFQVGLIATTTLLGSGVLTLLIGVQLRASTTGHCC